MERKLLSEFTQEDIKREFKCLKKKKKRASTEQEREHI